MKTSLELLIATLVCLAAAVVYSMVGDPGVDHPAADAVAGAPGPVREVGPPSPASTGPVKAPAPGNKTHFLTYRDVDRRFLVHVPEGYDPSKPCPVVLAFHDVLGTADLFVQQSQWDRFADRHGVLVVYPDGTGRSVEMLTFNAGACCGYAARAETDDVGFVAALLDALPSYYTIDRRRVYATGLGNGAMLCYRLACELPGRFAAIGPVGGGMTVDGPRPETPVPLVYFHGMQDRHAPFEGGIGPTPMMTNYHRAIPDVIAWWLDANGCEKEPARVERKKDYVLKRYAPAEGRRGAPVLLYTIPGAGHNWPGGVDATEHKGTGPFVKSVDVTALMWEFFDKFRSGDGRSEPGGAGF